MEVNYFEKIKAEDTFEDDNNGFTFGFLSKVQEDFEKTYDLAQAAKQEEFSSSNKENPLA